MYKGEDINSVEKVQKRYMTIRTTTNTKFDYPEGFVTSGRRKFVHVIAAYLFVTDSTDGSFERPVLASLHADFVQDDDYEDGYVCMLNAPLYTRKKYEQFNNVKSFNIWFEDYQGNKLDLTQGNVNVTLELMLEY